MANKNALIHLLILVSSGKLFKKVFNQAEIATLNPGDRRTYDESLKTYPDHYYRVIETAKKADSKAGRKKGGCY
jgi:hypothetical protein